MLACLVVGREVDATCDKNACVRHLRKHQATVTSESFERGLVAHVAAAARSVAASLASQRAGAWRFAYASLDASQRVRPSATPPVRHTHTRRLRDGNPSSRAAWPPPEHHLASTVPSMQSQEHTERLESREGVRKADPPGTRLASRRACALGLKDHGQPPSLVAMPELDERLGVHH